MSVITSARQRLEERRQAVADARARVDSLLAAGGTSFGAQLAAARGNLELAEAALPQLEAEAEAEKEAERYQLNSAAADQFLERESVTKRAFVAAVADARDALRRAREIADHHAQLVEWAKSSAEINGARPGDRLRWNGNHVAPVFTVDGRRIPGAISFTSWQARLNSEVLGTAGPPSPDLYPMEAAQT